MKKIYSVTSLILSPNPLNPALQQVMAIGNYDQPGWNNFVLVPVWQETGPPQNGIYEFYFMGNAPMGILPRMIGSTGVVTYSFNEADSLAVKQVVVIAESNSMSADRR
ncbi:MAG: hypothetical protein NTW29_01955 [Bacteroidetes bacterium]|nr:hypothetical protein [Bacteroidota bacterium]